MKKLKRILLFIFPAILAVGFSLGLVGCSGEIRRVSRNLSCYSMELVLNDDMTISGKQSVHYVNNSNTSISEICFHLYPRAFREDALYKPYTVLTSATCFPSGVSYGDIEILSAGKGEEKLEFEYVGEDEDILKVELDKPLEGKKATDIDLEFIITIPNCTHRFGYYEGKINLGNFYPIVCKFVGEEFDKTPYYATGDPFFSDLANYNVTLSFPSKYTLASTGNIMLENQGDTIGAKITADAVRDFAMNLSDDSKVLSSKQGETTVYFYGSTSDDNLEKYLDISVKALDMFNKSFGKYPYRTLSVVKTPFIYGGMEYPGIVFISDAIDDEDELLKVIVHEIAHQWWYGVVGNDEAREAWLDESLAEYSTALFFDANPGYNISYGDLVADAISSYTLYVDVIRTIRGDINTKMDLPVDKYQNDYEYSYMIYVKGVIMFDDLRNAVGKDRIISGLRKYYSDNKFKIATKEDFYKAFKAACHKDLENFFEGYLGGTTIIAAIN